LQKLIIQKRMNIEYSGHSCGQANGEGSKSRASQSKSNV
jgi:hypothetical protein